MKILVFDNYDSFTYNLVHLVEKILHQKTEVYRNDQIPLEKVKEYSYPVCFDFPVGHQKNNFALKCGVKHKLIVDIAHCSLTEIRS